MAPGLMCRGQMIIHLLAMLRSNRGDIEAPTRAVQPGHAKPTTFFKKCLEKTAPTLLRVIPTMAFQGIHSDILSCILFGVVIFLFICHLQELQTDKNAHGILRKDLALLLCLSMCSRITLMKQSCSTY